MKLFEPNEIKYLGKFYIYFLFFSMFLGLFLPFMTIYFVEKGFSFVEVSAILATFTISMVLFEVPTGAFADNYSRKYSTILGFVIMGLGVMPIPLVSSFWMILVLFIIQAIGMTFISGAEEAWVVENLKFQKMEKLVDDFYIKTAMIFAFGGILAPLIASWIVRQYSIDVIWYIFGIGSLLTAFFATVVLPELNKPQPSDQSTIKATTQKMMTSFQYVLNQKSVLYVMLGGVFFTVMWVVINFWQPFLVELSLPIYALGYLYSAMSVLSFLFPLGLKLFKNVSKIKLLILITSLKMLLAFTVAILNPDLLWLAIGIFVLTGALSELSWPLINPVLQKIIPSDKRATVMSINSMAVSGISGLFTLMFGIFADRYGLQSMIVMSGVWGIVAILFFAKSIKITKNIIK